MATRGIWMHRLHVWFGLALALLVALESTEAWAKVRVALIVGNSSYEIGPLPNAVNDARLMQETLTNVGFETILLENVSRSSFERALAEFSRKLKAAGKASVGIVYYAGHAAQFEGENYLIPVEAQIRDTLDLRIQTVDLGTIMASLKAAGNSLNIVILDSCRNNPYPAVSRSTTRGLAETKAPSGTMVAFSTQPNNVAADGKGRNSPYTRALARAIQSPGLLIEQIFKRVRVEVMERTGQRQVPWESSSLVGDFYFEPPVKAVQTADPNVINAISVTTDREWLQSLTDGREGAAYAGLARARLKLLEQLDANIRAEEAAAALQAKLTEEARKTAEADILFWNSINNSENRNDYRLYLDRFPNGQFASLAKDRVENGFTRPRVASIPEGMSLHPYDGAWRLSWRLSDNPWSFAWCRPGEQAELNFNLLFGRYKGRMTSNKDSQASMEVDITPEGIAMVTMFVSEWSVARNRVRLNVSNGSAEATFIPSTGNCASVIALSRR
jgi:uncharacterized caspase-like protein